MSPAECLLIRRVGPVVLSLVATGCIGSTRGDHETSGKVLELVRSIPLSSLDSLGMNPTDFALPHSDTLVVLDAVSGSIAVLDTSGKVLRTFGRRGGGPKEFGQPSMIEADGAGRIALLDRSRNRILITNTLGGVQRELVIDRDAVRGFGWEGQKFYTISLRDLRRAVGYIVWTSNLTSAAHTDSSSVRFDLVDARVHVPGALACRWCAVTMAGDGNLVVGSADTAYVLTVLQNDGPAEEVAPEYPGPAAPALESERQKILASVRSLVSDPRITLERMRAGLPRFRNRLPTGSMVGLNNNFVAVSPISGGDRVGIIDLWEFGLEAPELVGSLVLGREVSHLKSQHRLLHAMVEGDSSGGAASIQSFRVMLSKRPNGSLRDE